MAHSRPASWSLRTLPDGALHHPLWAPLLLFQIVAGVLLLAATMALLVLLLKGRGNRAYVAWAFAQTALLFASAALLAALPGGHGSGLDPALRDGLLSLVALVPGTALALSRAGRAGHLGGDVVSSMSSPRAS